MRWQKISLRILTAMLFGWAAIPADVYPDWAIIGNGVKAKEA